MTTIKNKELAEEVAKLSGVEQEDVEKVLNEVAVVSKKHLDEGNKVQISGTREARGDIPHARDDIPHARGDIPHAATNIPHIVNITK